MKLVDRTTFLTLPAGTVYTKYRPCVAKELCIKHDNVGYDDWHHTPLDSVFLASPFTDLLHMNVGESVNIDTDVSCRDGDHDKDDVLFLVYSQDDIKKIITLLTESLTVSTEGNENVD